MKASRQVLLDRRRRPRIGPPQPTSRRRVYRVELGQRPCLLDLMTPLDLAYFVHSLPPKRKVSR